LSSKKNSDKFVFDTGANFSAWNNYLEPYKGQRWADIPWFFAETYFYRLILEITNYFRPGEWQGVDPFHLQKTQGLEATIESIRRCKLSKTIRRSPLGF
jgi:Damage-control phosphatase ARMT1-like domain